MGMETGLSSKYDGLVDGYGDSMVDVSMER